MFTSTCHTHFTDTKRMTIWGFSCIPIAQWCSLTHDWMGVGVGER